MRAIFMRILLVGICFMSCKNDIKLVQQVECTECGIWISNEVIQIDKGQYITTIFPLIELKIFEDDSVYVSGEIRYTGKYLEGSFQTAILSGKKEPILEIRLDKKYINTVTHDYPTVVIRGFVDVDVMYLDIREYLIDSRARQILEDPDDYSISPYLADINNNLDCFKSVYFNKQ